MKCCGKPNTCHLMLNKNAGANPASLLELVHHGKPPFSGNEALPHGVGNN